MRVVGLGENRGEVCFIALGVGWTPLVLGLVLTCMAKVSL